MLVFYLATIMLGFQVIPTDGFATDKITRTMPMPINTIIMVVIVVVIGLIVFNFVFESFKYLINIVVIIGLVVWLLYAFGIINNLPNVNGLYDKAHDAITNIKH